MQTAGCLGPESHNFLGGTSAPPKAARHIARASQPHTESRPGVAWHIPQRKGNGPGLAGSNPETSLLGWSKLVRSAMVRSAMETSPTPKSIQRIPNDQKVPSIPKPVVMTTLELIQDLQHLAGQEAQGNNPALIHCQLFHGSQKLQASVTSPTEKLSCMHFDVCQSVCVRLAQQHEILQRLSKDGRPTAAELT